MNGRMLITLLVKDWRVYRAPVLSAAILGVAPYLIDAAVSPGARSDVLGADLRTINVAHTVGDSALLGLGVTVLLAAAFGGMAFAAERRDRSADFLALLPPGRAWVAASKAAVAVAALAVAFAFHFALFRWAVHLTRFSGPTAFDRGLVPAVTATAAAAFGLAWAMSAVLNSAAVSAVAAAAVVAAAALALSAAGAFDGADAVESWTDFADVVGAVGFSAGSICFILRLRP